MRKILFHHTSNRYVWSILKWGLKPKIPRGWPDQPKGVYLTNDYNSWWERACRTTGTGKWRRRYGITTLAVDTIGFKLHKDTYRENGKTVLRGYYVTDRIPPKRIRVIPNDEL